MRLGETSYPSPTFNRMILSSPAGLRVFYLGSRESTLYLHGYLPLREDHSGQIRRRTSCARSGTPLIKRDPEFPSSSRLGGVVLEGCLVWPLRVSRKTRWQTLLMSLSWVMLAPMTQPSGFRRLITITGSVTYQHVQMASLRSLRLSLILLPLV